MATKTVGLGTFSVQRNIRTDLKSMITKNWVGREHSGVYLQYIRYTYRPSQEHAKYALETNGKIVVPKHSFERDDVFLIQWMEPGINVFVDLTEDGYSVSIQPWNGVNLDDNDRAEIEKVVAGVMSDPANVGYIADHRRWFTTKPWKSLDGLTPEEAVEKLESMGW